METPDEKYAAHMPKREAQARESARSGRAVLTYAQKHAQANREALYTVVALAATIVVWTALGFGLSGLDVELFSTPLWVIGGTVGTWVFAIVVTVVLAKRLFRNFDLDEMEQGGQEPAGQQVKQGSEQVLQTEQGSGTAFQHEQGAGAPLSAKRSPSAALRNGQRTRPLLNGGSDAAAQEGDAGTEEAALASVSAPSHPSPAKNEKKGLSPFLILEGDGRE